MVSKAEGGPPAPEIEEGVDLEQMTYYPADRAVRGSKRATRYVHRYIFSTACLVTDRKNGNGFSGTYSDTISRKDSEIWLIKMQFELDA